MKHLAQFRFARKKIVILPWIAIRYFIYTVAVMAGLIILADRIFISQMEKEQKLSSKNWEYENVKINQNNAIKIKKHPLMIWQSSGFQVFEKKTTDKRILVIGDSFVWGDGYANMNDIWWRQLQRELYDRGYRDIEVIALGFNGAWTRIQFDFVKKVIPRYAPDIVIWGYVSNDPDERDSKGKQIVKQRDFQKNDTAEYLKRLKSEDWAMQIISSLTSYLPNIAYHAERLRLEKLKSTNPIDSHIYGYRYGEWEKRLYQGGNFEQYKDTVKMIADYFSTTELPVFFLSLPNGPSDNILECFSKAEAVFTEHGLLFFNIVEDVNRNYKDKKARLKFGINPANGHPGKIMTRFYAKKAVDIIEDSYPQLLPPKQTENTTLNFTINDWAPIETPLVQQQNRILFFPFSQDNPNYNKRIFTMPYEKPFTQLNFSEAVYLDKIQLQSTQKAGNRYSSGGDNLLSAQIILNYENFEEIDEEILEERPGPDILWKNEHPDKKVNEIKIMTKFRENHPENRGLFINMIRDNTRK